MILINIFLHKNYKNINNKHKLMTDIKSLFNIYTLTILLFINFMLTLYLLIVNNKNSGVIKGLLGFEEKKLMENNYSFKYSIPNNDKELIGLHYPEINFDKIKKINIFPSLLDLISQLENKLIYLEKEINVTKIVSFYTSRKIFFKEHNIKYEESNLKELHEIVNWIIIHKSNQLKGIASDKYLACKYVKLKLGKNLCQHRIDVYDKFEDLDYNNLSKYGDIVLKVSNSCWKTILIPGGLNKNMFKQKLEELKKLLEFEHGLVEAQFFHLYAKKRIIVEKQFSPSKDLYEFKFFIINKDIKFIYLLCTLNEGQKILVYDSNYNFLFKEKNVKLNPLNLKSIFKKKLLNQLKNYAIKLSEDFPNFIRVDLYAFHNQIYLSELTFASYNGIPMFRNESFVKESVEHFSRVDDYY